MMKRVIASIIISLVLAVFAGIGIQYCLIDTPFHHHDSMPLLWPIIYSAHFYALLINVIFFYIRRLGGNIENIAGLTLTMIIYISTTGPLYFLKMHFDENLKSLMSQFAFIVFAELAVIGFVSTHFLKTKNYKST